MSKSVVLSLRAKQNVSEILNNVYDYTLFASTPHKLMQEFTKTFENIGIFPQSGRLQEDGTRIIFCRHYRIVYKELGEQVVIITVIHSRRLYPQILP